MVSPFEKCRVRFARSRGRLWSVRAEPCLLMSLDEFDTGWNVPRNLSCFNFPVGWFLLESDLRRQGPVC